MDDWQFKREFRGQYKTVAELEVIKEEKVAALEVVAQKLGADGISALKEKRESESPGIGRPRHEYSDDEIAYMGAVSIVEACDELIQERQSLDAILLDPKGFEGFIDREATKELERRYAPIAQRITLKEPYAVFVKGLEKIRKEMGLGDICPDDAFARAVQLEKTAGLKGVVVGDANDVEAFGVFMEQLKEDVDALNLFSGFVGDKDDRADFEREINAFYIPVRNGLQLKPIDPVRVEFGVAVNAIVGAVPSAVFGNAPRPHSNDTPERSTEAAARRYMTQLALNDPQLRAAVEAFIVAAEGKLRSGGHVVLEHPVDEDDAALDALKMKPPGEA